MSSVLTDHYNTTTSLSLKHMGVRVSSHPRTLRSIPASSHHAKLQQQRLRFALFLKILFKRLQESDDKLLYVQAKMLVLSCSQRSRMGDMQYTPLVDAIEVRLRELVGEVHWRRAHGYMRYFISSRNPRGFAQTAMRRSRNCTNYFVDCTKTESV